MRRKTLNRIILVLFLLLIAAIVAMLVLFVTGNQKYDGSVAAFNELKERTDGDIDALKADKKRLEADLSVLEVEKAELASNIETLEEEKSSLIQSFNDSDARYRELNERLDALRAEVAQRDAAIADLKENIAKLEKMYQVDINAQFEILNQLTELLENPVMIEIKTEKTLEDGTVEEEITYRAPRIGLYYEDINNGYKYSFNEKEVFDSASLIKEPFILSVLQQASIEAENIRNTPPQYDADGNEIEPARTFDFGRTITYTAADYYQSGSGKIRESEDGTVYTHLELIQHLLKYSDNVAYSVLRGEYDLKYFRDMVYRLGATSMYSTLSNMSAADAGKMMIETHHFIESGAEYSSLMYDSMVDSAHTVMIPYSVLPKKTAHKYGWDTGAYHDMGIVYAENPYVVAIMTDYDMGGNEVNEYIQSILKLVDKLHTNFYVVK